MNGLNGSYPGQRTIDPSCCEVTMLNQLNERRDSTTSTMSSIYTLSRRSSGISPCYSSRRSSEASQFGGSRHNNMSSADSYDPISTDMSRRSSEASQCGGGGVNGGGSGGGGGLPSLLSLTPAQHYRLKAKYAAAVGGAPPTPLPNMDRMSLRTRMALYGDPQEASSYQLHRPPAGSAPRRCSDLGHGSQSMMPHEVPMSLPRRASDPVRRPTLEPLSVPRVQRYNSMNSMNPMNPSTMQERYRGLGSHVYTRSDGSLQRQPFAPRPPSISENVAMENMAVDGMMVGGDQLAEDDIVLPDDVVQYLRAQNSGPSGQSFGQAEYQSNNQAQGYQPGAPNQQHTFYGQRRMAMVNANMPQTGQDFQSCQLSPGGSQQPFQTPSELSKNNMPVQWNEVSSGTMETTAKLSKQPHPIRGNLAVVQQQHNFGLFQGQAQGLVSNQQVMPMSQNMALQGYTHHNNQRVTLQQRQMQYSNVNLSEQMSPQQGFGQEMVPNSVPGNASMRPPFNGMMDQNNPEILPFRSRTEGYPHGNLAEQQQNFNGQQHGGLQNGGRGMFQPRPPIEPKSVGRQHSISNAVMQSRFPQSSEFSSSNDNNTSEASPKRPSISSSENPNSTIFYTGQIHMFKPNSGNCDAPMSPCASHDAANATSAAVANVASPGVNQVTSSTVDSSTGGPGATEHAQIDFDAMLDNGDHSSLMSGTLSPGLLQSLSQSSSRLTTPRNSVTLASVPPGISNMAIGDMTSMLTALAEENKFLNMIS